MGCGGGSAFVNVGGDAAIVPAAVAEVVTIFPCDCFGRAGRFDGNDGGGGDVVIAIALLSMCFDETPLAGAYSE
jgi:hypothetical protein